MRRARVLYSREQTWQYGAMPQAAKLSGLGVLFVAGLLLAGAITAGGRAAQTTTTETTLETTTAPGTTESTTVTVQQTTTGSSCRRQRRHHRRAARAPHRPGSGSCSDRGAGGDRSTRGVPHAPRWATRRPRRGAPASARRRGRKLDGSRRDGRSTIRRRTPPSCAAATRCCSSPLTRLDMSAPGRSHNRTVGRGRVR